MIEVTYYYSACVGIRTEDVSILCDPWFTDGIYDGSWYQYPKLKNPTKAIGSYEYIYISHILPDHYDSKYLKEYLAEYSNAKVIIAPFTKNFLAKKMTVDGIPHEVISTRTIRNTRFSLFPNELNEYDVDSALCVRTDMHSVVNMNDNSFNPHQLDEIIDFCQRKPDIALLSYTGAGPYPQTYYSDIETLKIKAEEKKQSFFNRYFMMKNYLRPRKVIPFAGKYFLGGKLASLNQYRGVADAVEVLNLDADAVVLADGGLATINTKDLIPSSVRTKAYLVSDINECIKKYENVPMLYEEYFEHLPVDAIPFFRLLTKAYNNAHLKSLSTIDHYFCFKLQKQWCVININKNTPMIKIVDNIDHYTPRHELYVDEKHLFGLLTGVFHWNNAEVGSLYMSRRYPDSFNREAMSFLNFFHV